MEPKTWEATRGRGTWGAFLPPYLKVLAERHLEVHLEASLLALGHVVHLVVPQALDLVDVKFRLTLDVDWGRVVPFDQGGLGGLVGWPELEVLEAHLQASAESEACP